MKLLLFRDEFEVALKVHAQASQSEQAAAEAASKTTSLTSEQLTRVFTASAIPFVGFGFLDNLIMVRAAGLGPTIPTGISQHVIQPEIPQKYCIYTLSVNLMPRLSVVALDRNAVDQCSST